MYVTKHPEDCPLTFVSLELTVDHINVSDLAPEVILSRGYDKAVDYWSFGVLVYELLVGVSPFYRKGTSQMDMFKRIVLVEYDLPQCVPSEGSDMVKKLL